MIIEIDGLDLWYEVLGKGEPVLVLHGWGGDIDSVRPLIEQLGGKFQAYGLDLPGFGRSGLPDKPWGTHDYQRLVSRFISRLDLAPVYIIGHSFGGRIGICLGAEEPQLIKKLVLVDSAGIKPKRTLAYYLKVYAYKLGKTLLKPWGSLGGRGLKRWHKLFGSQDYNQSGALRKTLVKVVNEDLRDLLPKIKPPTLLIWGSEDSATPLSDGRTMKEQIPDSRLVIFEGAGHYSYLERFNDFCKALDDFFQN